MFSEKLFSESSCLRETVLEKPFSERSFYELQPRSFKFWQKLFYEKWFC